MKSRSGDGDGRSFCSRIARGARTALTRIIIAWIITRLVFAIGFGGLAVAGEPDIPPVDWLKAVTSACAPHPPSDASWEAWAKGARMYDRGVEALKHKDKDRAAGELDAAIKLYPNNALAHAARGELYRGEGKYDRAVDEESQAIKLAPGCFAAFNDRCWARAIMGDLQAALADCNEALRMYQRSANIFDSRGFVYLRMGNFDKAIADYDAALQIDRFYPTSLFGRGKARLMKGDEAGGSIDVLMAEQVKSDIAEEMARYGVK